MASGQETSRAVRADPRADPRHVAQLLMRREVARMSDPNRYDADPDALAWARKRVQHYIDRCETWAAQGGPHAEESRKFATLMHMWFIGHGEGCVISAFDKRLPQIVQTSGEA